MLVSTNWDINPSTNGTTSLFLSVKQRPQRISQKNTAVNSSVSWFPGFFCQLRSAKVRSYIPTLLCILSEEAATGSTATVNTIPSQACLLEKMCNFLGKKKEVSDSPAADVKVRTTSASCPQWCPCTSPPGQRGSHPAVVPICSTSHGIKGSWDNRDPFVALAAAFSSPSVV